MQSGTPQQQTAGRRIMVERYGSEQIDLMLSRGAATGSAPIADAVRAQRDVQQLPALRTAAPPKVDALDWFLHCGRKIF